MANGPPGYVSALIEYYDNVDLDVTVTGFPAAGTYTATLYLYDGGSWDPKDSGSGNTKITLSYEGDYFDDDEDDWLVLIEASSWASGTCSTAYTLTIAG